MRNSYIYPFKKCEKIWIEKRSQQMLIIQGILLLFSWIFFKTCLGFLTSFCVNSEIL